MAQTQTDSPTQDPASPTDSQGQMQQSLWRRFFGRDKENSNNGGSGSTDTASKGQGSEQHDKAGLIRRVSRKVVPGLPRAQTFKRQQSELRNNLEPVQQTPAERRAVSMDRRMHPSNSAFSTSNPRTSAPDFLNHSFSATASVPSLPTSPTAETRENMLDSIGELNALDGEVETLDDQAHDAISNIDAHSMTTSQYDSMIHDELERIWILNLSMHFRDKSKREKFFVTYREHNTLWRRVTVSLDYRNAPENSLEMELVHTKFQRDKSAKIYEAIRESLGDIQFYDTVTNLKLQTTDGRLHVHVVEDVNEIIHYPPVRTIQHMRCRRVKERELEFDSHMSGFVYKVRVNGEVLIKKEIPGPDTVDEFLYEINALNRLRYAENVIQFYGVVVDDKEEYIKGLLISYAEQGALFDVIYDHNHSLPWSTREKWARQIVNGLAEIHECGFVQGDFTLSNIVINDEGDAKIIDINRRGCPVGWEPPEATPLIESNQRISMYIGVKSDLFQLGMVLWALATQEDEPEAHGRPLHIGADVQVPLWYRQIVAICLSEDPRRRLQALHLATMFPEPREESQYGPPNGSSISVDDRYSHHEFGTDSFTANGARIRTVEPPSDWSYLSWGSPQHPTAEDLYYYPTRGRSPPSPMPSNHGEYENSRYGPHLHPWPDKHHLSNLTVPSFSDAHASEPQAVPAAVFGVSDRPGQGTGIVEKQPDSPMAALSMERGTGDLPSKTIHLQSDTEQVHKPTHDSSDMLMDVETAEKARSGSQADSGKDLSKSVITPRASSTPSRNFVDMEQARDGDEKEMTVRVHNEAQALAETQRQRHDGGTIPDTISEMRGNNLGLGLYTSTSFSSSRGTSASTPTRELPDELKGVGSAYDLTSEKRQHAVILEDDLNMDAGALPSSKEETTVHIHQQTTPSVPRTAPAPAPAAAAAAAALAPAPEPAATLMTTMTTAADGG